MILGLTGSFGSGKSTVANMFKSLGGAVVIDADQVARDLQKPGESGFTGVVAEFGPDVINTDGELDRAKLAGIVFNDPARLQKLNDIIHPLVWERVNRLFEELKDHPLVVFMVPLLFETGTDRFCDQVVVVTITEEERFTRLKARYGLTSQQIESRLAAQMPQDEKVEQADLVINNSGSQEETKRQVAEILETIRVSATKGS